MPEEWFEVAYINYYKGILYGRVMETVTDYTVMGLDPSLPRTFRRPREVEQVLTEEQKNAIVDLNERHQDEMQALLKSFVDV